MKCDPTPVPASLRTDNLNVRDIRPLVTPRELQQALPTPPDTLALVTRTRQAICEILAGRDRRLLVVAGPCSIHDPAAALDYASRLAKVAWEVRDTLLVLMRVYGEKPRTTVGWKGLIYDPRMDDSSDIAGGLGIARDLLLKINALGLPAGTEMLDPIVPQYTADLISWVAIGARTTESQTHRQMASGLSMPVGFKNRTDGNIQVAVDALESARHPHSFLGIDGDGRTSIVRTAGNPWGHLILRGSSAGPNHDAASVKAASDRMTARGLQPTLMVDCSHGNAGKRFANEEKVWSETLAQRLAGNGNLIGLLLESHLFEGNQPIPENRADLRYGVSVTDECLGWTATEALLRQADQALRQHG
jgi:3-deoxy-7-phosphoheptulonate synthase